MRRSQLALEKAEAALTQAEDESAQGVEKVNNTRLSAAQAAKKAGAEERKGDDDEEEEEEEVGEGDWERATEENLAKALEDAKDAVNHARSHVIGGCRVLFCFVAFYQRSDTHREQKENRKRTERDHFWRVGGSTFYPWLHNNKRVSLPWAR